MDEGRRAEAKLSAEEVADGLRGIIMMLQTQLAELDRLGVSHGAGDLDMAICRLQAVVRGEASGLAGNMGQASGDPIEMPFHRPLS